MSQTTTSPLPPDTAAEQTVSSPPALLPLAPESNREILRELLALAIPVCAEHVLHILVGWNDTYLANHIHRYEVATQLTRADEIAAGAAVGTITYVLWFIGLLVSAVGTGSTAIIARAVGAKHRSLANSVCGQSVLLAAMVGIGFGLLMFFAAAPIADSAGLPGDARTYAYVYLRILALSMPLSMVMFIANSCLRGAGDTLTPAITMIVVDVINVVFSFAMTYGWFFLPKLGFDGIAWGTMIAYAAGGIIQFVVLVRGTRHVKLFPHRLLPDWHNIKRVLRIGLPGGAGDMLQWIANFGVVRYVNEMGAAQGNAHSISIRIESVSYMLGYAVATAAATLVGQSLGMKRPHRAQRAAMISYAVGGGIMISMGVFFVLFGKAPARLFSDDLVVQNLVANCLFITGFIQCGFASALIFGGALRGAGDTFFVMIINIVSIVGVRFLGVAFVAGYLHRGLAAVWFVLCTELLLRGSLMLARFIQGSWKRVIV